jgi:hypothetical protein
MDRSKVVGGIVGLLYMAGIASCVFNFDVTSCDDFPMPGCPGVVPHDGGPDADSGPPPACIPSENPQAVASSCGVFVSSSKGNDTSGDGTKGAPFASLTKALSVAVAKGKPVYACGEVFDKETVSISTRATLFGALDCTNQWKHDASKKTQLSPTAEGIALTISKATTSAEVFDFAITSADPMQAGGSSIAVLVAQASASFTNCDITAGIGKEGSAGVVQSQVQTPADANGKDGTDDAACTMTNNIPGGDGGTNTCDGTPTNGGKGGKGIPDATGGLGGDGLPLATPGNGGAGQSSSACKQGQQGTDGGPGSGGTGARGIGDVSASGYQSAMAALGGNGQPGQGGGGGGGARACDSPANTLAGPSGGGGGAGGCGGAPGNPGQSGGSSIGILALSAKLTLNTVSITAKSGGAGGLGGDGQRGGNGGSPGHAVGGAACDGGKGGQGGAGGPGGGGAGGHSIGIAAKGGTLPNLASTTIHHEGSAPGGAGGDMDMTAHTKGDGGLACATIDFAKPASCMP